MIAGIATDAPTTDASTGGVIMPRPIKVGAFLKQVDKDIEGFSRQYGILSEYAHPNWAGTVYLYAKHDPENRLTEFARNIRRAGSTKHIGVGNLSVALAMFEASYNRIATFITAFIQLCENRLKNAQGQ